MIFYITVIVYFQSCDYGMTFVVGGHVP